MSDSYRQLVDAIREHSGMDVDEIISAGEHGADAGWPEFTYTVDGARFYREHDDKIDELAQSMADDMGYESVAELVATFTRRDMADSRDGRDCLMAWFALEECGRWLADNRDEYDDDDDDDEIDDES